MGEGIDLEVEKEPDLEDEEADVERSLCVFGGRKPGDVGDFGPP